MRRLNITTLPIKHSIQISPEVLIFVSSQQMYTFQHRRPLFLLSTIAFSMRVSSALGRNLCEAWGATSGTRRGVQTRSAESQTQFSCTSNSTRGPLKRAVRRMLSLWFPVATAPGGDSMYTLEAASELPFVKWFFKSTIGCSIRSWK